MLSYSMFYSALARVPAAKTEDVTRFVHGYPFSTIFNMFTCFQQVNNLVIHL